MPSGGTVFLLEVNALGPRRTVVHNIITIDGSFLHSDLGLAKNGIF